MVSACSNNISNSKSEEILSDEQQELVDDFQHSLDEDNAEIIFYSYNNSFKDESDFEQSSDKLIELYNEAVLREFKESKEEFFDYGTIIDYSILNNDIYNEIISYKDSRLEEIITSMQASIKREDYAKAKELYSRTIRNESTDIMYEYSSVRESDKNGYRTGSGFINVSPYYDGVLAEEILAYASTKNGSLDDWVELYNRVNAGKIDITKIKVKNPTIGMTEDEVVVTSWGKPQKVNRSVNQYNTREQWVYGNGQYLYFTDGILTSFQD